MVCAFKSETAPVIDYQLYHVHQLNAVVVVVVPHSRPDRLWLSFYDKSCVCSLYLHWHLGRGRKGRHNIVYGLKNWNHSTTVGLGLRGLHNSENGTATLNVRFPHRPRSICWIERQRLCGGLHTICTLSTWFSFHLMFRVGEKEVCTLQMTLWHAALLLWGWVSMSLLLRDFGTS